MTASYSGRCQKFTEYQKIIKRSFSYFFPPRLLDVQSQPIGREIGLKNKNEINKGHYNDGYHHGYPNGITGWAVVRLVNGLGRWCRILFVSRVVVFRFRLAVLIRSVTVRFHNINLWCCLGNNPTNHLFGLRG